MESDTNICRICLLHRSKLRSVFEIVNTLSLVEMITNIANIKIYEGDGYSHKICLFCCTKVQDYYEFKHLIERSDRKFHITYDKIKKINFNNLNDIKIDIECLKIKTEDTEEKNGNHQFIFNIHNDTTYNNTTIKKLNIKNENLENEDKQVLSVEDFLNTIEDEMSNNDDYDDSEEFDEYLPPYIEKKKTYKQKSKGTIKSKLRIKNKIPDNKQNKIKPIILEDVRLMSTQSYNDKSKKVPKKYKYRSKETICPYCGRITRSMKSHLLIHTGEKSFKCNKCPKAFFKSNQLAYHKRVHSDIKEFKCDHCVAAFHHKSIFRQHMLTHVDVKTHVCVVCNKAFKRKNTLRRHIIRHSSANRTFKCENCNMSFFEKFQLNHHMRVHTGERPYNCQICSQPYSYKPDFNRHCFKKHGVFIKRRSVYVMNEEVLAQERALMREVFHGAQSVVVDSKPVNPFQGPQAAMAYHQTLKALDARHVHLLDNI